jgi:hypothetical protein
MFLAPGWQNCGFVDFGIDNFNKHGRLSEKPMAGPKGNSFEPFQA